jgi:hypothetical protein
MVWCLFVLYVAMDNLPFTEAEITLRTWTNREKGKKIWYKCYSNEKVEDMPKSRAQFTPMRTTAADSRTKIVITLDSLYRPNPLFDKHTVSLA